MGKKMAITLVEIAVESRLGVIDALIVAGTLARAPPLAKPALEASRQPQPTVEMPNHWRREKGVAGMQSPMQWKALHLAIA
jgi:hypothetical protein